METKKHLNAPTCVQDLINELTSLTWSTSWECVHIQIEQLLKDCWFNRHTLFCSLREFIASRACTLTVTSELHSWMLYDPGGWILKLNQFKPDVRVGRASEGIHNHMRPLTTLTLGGWYAQDFYYPDHVYADGEKYGALYCSPGPTTHPGYVYTVGPDVFHALNDFAEGTLTLVVYGLVQRDHITRFNIVKGVAELWRRHDTAKRTLFDQLKMAESLADRRHYEISDQSYR